MIPSNLSSALNTLRSNDKEDAAAATIMGNGSSQAAGSKASKKGGKKKDKKKNKSLRESIDFFKNDKNNGSKGSGGNFTGMMF